MDLNHIKGCFITGQFVHGSTVSAVEVVDKYRGELLKRLPLAAPEQVE